MKIDLISVKNELERLRCPVHHQAAKASIAGESIKLSTCCDEFLKKLRPKLDALIKKAVDKSISDELGNIFM